MTYWRRSVDYIEYYSASQTKINNLNDNNTAHIKNTGRFDFTPFQLAIGTAKALITNSNVYTKETMILAKSYIDQFPILLTEDPSGNLRINYSFRNLFRDFSKTSRVGEIAQGINYIFAQNTLECVAIHDFDEYLEALGLRKRYMGKKPDYVTVYRDKSRGILESKGGITNPTLPMLNGLKQCADGGKVISVRRTYSSAIWFSIDGPRTSRKTTIHFIDPQEQNGWISVEKYRQSLINEYAKWFCIAGQYDVAKELSSGVVLQNSNHIRYSPVANFELSNIIPINEREDLLVLAVREYENLGSTYRIYFGINKRILHFISGETETAPNQEEYYSYKGSDFVREQYVDGTWIVVIGDDLSTAT